ncbi:hypothetical protein BOTBODRAFT_155649 [Botryobasidium botryosum FD-172 SS1]|uniref:Hemerythrin-like domain-containing protein n=1 Tax=Botryobasidium botryosum (strain FD-172 SS1) TaxID=930990 RepID=A0A067N090_BOTB1|nr:hypothetical protein BOTBODRAFT_155649 [Botryobasidium botryosum FD-172 SS1]
MTVTIRWADGPWPLIETPSKTMDVKRHAGVQLATDMCHPHNAMIRGINAIYLQAPYVKNPTDIADLLIFCQNWCQMVEHHHKVEEEFLFPSLEKVLEKPGFFDGEIEQHNGFHAGFDEMREYVKEMTPENFNAATLIGIIDKFGTSFQQHLSDEVQTLLSLEKEPKADSVKLLKVWKDMEAMAVKQGYFLPFVLGLCDRTYEGGIHHFPPIPNFVCYIAHYWYGRRNCGAWRFCPSDIWKNPRPLMFLPENQRVSA